ncbi:unnamed protein product [Ranitomeya imitator]|uniref:Tc1-like transposase DDE domain-containing protein n=1 Tax=Ranitomeya imitator TaxID=111125 RepID=A0ABN9LMB7_9NEOB|nr:unnamed protein product [Ranitomeya imitator]
MSPELNPIEHLWRDLKMAVWRRQPSNIRDLEQFAKEEWSKIPAEFCKKLIDGYRKRLVAASGLIVGLAAEKCSHPADIVTKIKPFGEKHFHVAICSRDNEANFQWLKDLMRRSKKVKSADTVTVTNDFSRFSQEMSQFTFAVLYHTRKRGRINVTNVTDSLYDEELKFLHDELGKNNVIVVIDDLENSTDREKERIFHSQSSIKEYSGGLFLFSEDDKNNLRDEKSAPPDLQMRLSTFQLCGKKKEEKSKEKQKLETREEITRIY